MCRLTPFWTLFILTGLNLFNYLDRYVLGAVLPAMQRDEGLNDQQGGWIGTAFMIGYFLTSPIFGYLGDRGSRKWLIVVGIAVWSAGTVLTGFAHGLLALLAFRALVGLGEASYATVSPGILSDVYPAEKRNNALTVFYAAIPFGAAFGNLLGGWISEHWGWRHAFIWAGAPGLLLALVLLPFADPPRTENPQDHKPTVREIFGLFRRGEYNLVVWGYTAYTFAMGAFAHWGPSFLQRIHGLPQDHPFFGIALVVSGLVGTVAGGLLATKWQRKTRAGYALLLGFSVLAAVPVTWLAFTVANATAAMALLGAGMILLFLSTGPVNTLILETVPAALRASAMAGSIFVIHLFGDLWSPAIIGLLGDRWGLGRAVLILPVALLVGAALWLALARRQSGAPSLPPVDTSA